MNYLGSNLKIYKVGGAIRDRLLDRSVKEVDWVVVGATPEQMLNQGFKPVGKAFPVFLHPDTKEEYALARTEKKIGPGYTGFDCYAAPNVSLEDDLKRRDLTINAMAEAENGDIIDPYHGQEDLANRVLRHVSCAFAEDPVRILRLARFAARYQAYGFTVAPETVALMKQMVVAGEAQHLVPERVWQEFYKALGEDYPSAFLQVLSDCGALPVVLPELDGLFERVDKGSLMSVDIAAKLSDLPQVRFAALVHDRGEGSIQRLCQRLPVPNDCKELALLVCRHRDACLQGRALTAEAIVTFFESVDAFRREGRFEAFLLACEADFKGRGDIENKDFYQGDFFRRLLAAVNEISVNAVLQSGLTGPKVGQAIHRLRVEKVKQLV